jgi:hypothetical protein
MVREHLLIGMDTTGDVTDRDRLLFAAGFMFGVLFAMLILAIVVATVTEGVLPDENVTLSLGIGIAVAGVAGVVMYLFAFPQNRVAIPIGGTATGAGDSPAVTDSDQADTAAARSETTDSDDRE